MLLRTMSRADRFLRESIEGFHRGEHAARLSRMREPEADREPGTVELGYRLVSSEGAEALAEVGERGELPAHEVEWLGKQVAHVRYAVASQRAERAARERLHEATTEGGGLLVLGEELARIALSEDERHRTESARSLGRVLMPLALPRMAAHARIESARYVEQPRETTADAARDPNAPPNVQSAKPSSNLLIVSAFDPDVLSPALRDLPAPSWLSQAQAFLDGTESAAEDAVRFLTRHKHRGGPVSWHTLLAGMRAAELDSDIGRKQRWSRAAAWLRGLGFEEDLHARLRAEVDHSAQHPFAQLALLDVPRDVRVAQSPRDFGAASDLCAADGVGRALALALTHAALPSELRWPIHASTSGVLGMLAMLVWSDRDHLSRIEGLSETQTERVARLCGTLVLLWTRLCVSVALLSSRDEDRPESRLEVFSGAIARALCTDAAPGLAGVLVFDRIAARDRALEALTGLASSVALRERWNPDWFRNPRTADGLRALAGRGNMVGPEGVFSELWQAAGRPVDAAKSPLGAQAIARAIELVS